MHTDKEIIEFIKEGYSLKPSEQFVLSTEYKLKQKARGISRSMMVKRASFAFSGLVLCIFAISWLFVFNGKETVINTINSFKEGNIPILIDKEETSIFIYQTHNLESFMPEINTEELREAFHFTKNISLVGERLSKELKERNIGTIHDESNISGILKERGLFSEESYIVSREVLKDVLGNNKNIKMAFDIHRDSAKRSFTTLNLKGEYYARIAFILSDSSSNFRENQKFAELLHKKMEDKYPGLSRGIIVKNTGNTYNLDVLEKSVLLEVGGVENKLEEEYRTVEALADVIKEVIDLEIK
ncbi:stage II sporulation protein P [Psychrobacillus glaciei]|uniref:Stage II sporulation protein P n=1 Tax=Psychrobacillus glaciei TaxID=2283160 RepID=A0A5J6SL13_9BACI|nr:stage II sporulation protein P [Psychrobacillus glaciei]QFF98660.1 stage II sporulation protein P [Psychrobacillus glaciei]